MLLIGIWSSYTDLKSGVVLNRELTIIAVIGIVIDIVYYLFFVRDIIFDFAINCAVVFAILLFLYGMHSFAGGDVKLGVVFAILYPARLYLVYKSSIVTLFFALGFAFIFGYIWLVGDSIFRFIKSGGSGGLAYIKKFLLRYLIMYFISFVYVMLVNMLINELAPANIPAWIAWLVCIGIALLVKKESMLRKWYVVMIVLLCDIAVSIVCKIQPFSTYPGTYIFTGALILCQMFVNTNIYTDIKTDDVQKGMILSSVSTMMMSSSKVKGLPGISSESLKDRLTEDEAESVRRWGKTKNGQETVTILKKIPFALFLVLGFFVYLIIWFIIHEI